MNFQEVIDKRHSIREYEKRPVPRKILKEIIISATKAPSAANWQPWNFTIIQNKKILYKISKILCSSLKKEAEEYGKLNEKLKRTFNRFYSDFGNAPCLILVHIDMEKKRTYRDSKLLSVAAAIENLMLSAINEELGTCWLGSVKSLKDAEKNINKLLKIKNKELVTGVIIGYPKKGYKPLIRKKRKLNEVLKFV